MVTSSCFPSSFVGDPPELLPPDAELLIELWSLVRSELVRVGHLGEMLDQKVELAPDGLVSPENLLDEILRSRDQGNHPCDPV